MNSTNAPQNARFTDSIQDVLRHYLNVEESRFSCDSRSGDASAVQAIRAAINALTKERTEASADRVRLNWLQLQDEKRTEGEDLPHCVIAYPSHRPFLGKTLREAIDSALEERY